MRTLGKMENKTSRAVVCPEKYCGWMSRGSGWVGWVGVGWVGSVKKIENAHLEKMENAGGSGWAGLGWVSL